MPSDGGRRLALPHAPPNTSAVSAPPSSYGRYRPDKIWGLVRCIYPGDEDVTEADVVPGGPPNTRIAAQCCTGLNTGTPGCRRKPTSSGGVGGNEDCVAGNAGEDPDITPFTYAQVRARRSTAIPQLFRNSYSTATAHGASPPPHFLGRCTTSARVSGSRSAGRHARHKAATTTSASTEVDIYI